MVTANPTIRLSKTAHWHNEPAQSQNAVRLVTRLEIAGEWPAPALLCDIVRLGDAAVLALAAFIRGALMGRRHWGSARIAVGLLGSIDTPCARTVLLSLLRDCSGEMADAAAEALSDMGPGSALPCLLVAQQGGLPLSNRVAALTAACEAAMTDPDTISAVGRGLHRLLLGELCRGELQSRSGRQLAAAAVDGLSRLGYDAARASIDAAYDRGLVLNCELAYSAVADMLRSGGRRQWRHVPPPFLERYRQRYRHRFERSSPTARVRAPWSDDFSEHRQSLS